MRTREISLPGDGINDRTTIEEWARILQLRKETARLNARIDFFSSSLLWSLENVRKLQANNALLSRQNADIAESLSTMAGGAVGSTEANSSSSGGVPSFDEAVPLAIQQLIESIEVGDDAVSAHMPYDLQPFRSTVGGHVLPSAWIPAPPRSWFAGGRAPDTGALLSQALAREQFQEIPWVPREGVGKAEEDHEQEGSSGGVSLEKPPVRKPPKPWMSWMTTLVVTNIPSRYSQEMLLHEWAAEGPYDFFHLPYNPKQRRTVGYAFINFISNEAAIGFRDRWHGRFLDASLPGRGRCLEVAPAEVQGLEATLRHEGTMARVKRLTNPGLLPAVFGGGERLDFRNVLASLQ